MHARGALARLRVWGVSATQVISISHGYRYADGASTMNSRHYDILCLTKNRYAGCRAYSCEVPVGGVDVSRSPGVFPDSDRHGHALQREETRSGHDDYEAQVMYQQRCRGIT